MPLKSDHNAVWKENRNVVIKKQKTRQLTQQHNSEKKGWTMEKRAKEMFSRKKKMEVGHNQMNKNKKIPWQKSGKKNAKRV